MCRDQKVAVLDQGIAHKIRTRNVEIIYKYSLILYGRIKVNATIYFGAM